MCIFAKGHCRGHKDTIEKECISWRVRASLTHAERLPQDRVKSEKRKGKEPANVAGLLSNMPGPSSAAYSRTLKRKDKTKADDDGTGSLPPKKRPYSYDDDEDRSTDDGNAD